MTAGGSGRPRLDRFASAGALWIVDLDGVIWLSGEPIGDVSGAVADLRGAGVTVAFVTNNSAPTTDELLDRIDRVGIRASAEHLVSSAEAAASLLQPGESACVLGDQGLLDALTARGVEVRPRGGAAGVVGWSRSFDFDRLAAVATTARHSGILIGTNEDPTHPTPGGLLPGAGSLLAAVATASGVEPRVAGKPHRPMVELLRHRFHLGPDGPPTLVVGDQPETDGRLADALTTPFALVDSGVTRPGTVVGDVPVAVRTADFVHLVADALDGRWAARHDDRQLS
ncbi:MAG: HAD-IIA family hydrolase [Acidimicrobiales bacterium]|jgi:4-nitrophenyl phosphatase